MNNPARSNIKPLQNEQDKGTPLNQSNRTPVKKRRIKGRRLFLYGFGLWAAYVFFFVQVPALNRLHQDQQDLGKSIQQANQTSQDLQKKIQQLKDPAYIGQLARQKYMMVKDGETLFVEPK
jgi:cell division protein DivIC